MPVLDRSVPVGMYSPHARQTRPQQTADVTREKILDAAFHEIHRYGFQSASLANILERTGLTKGALYHHFPTSRRSVWRWWTRWSAGGSNR